MNSSLGLINLRHRPPANQRRTPGYPGLCVMDGPYRIRGKRLFADFPGLEVVTISHHLAHAYSAAGTCDFDECMVMVIDGVPNQSFLVVAITEVVLGIISWILYRENKSERNKQ